MGKHLAGVVPALRLSSRVQLAAFFPLPSGRGSRRRSAAPPPALMVDVRVVIRRNFPISPGDRRIVQEVAEDIVLRRQQARKLRLAASVERALAEDVLPFIEHPFDRRAVVAAREKICEYVARACSDPRLAMGGAQVLVLLDTFACPVLLRPLARKPMRISTCPAKHAVDIAMRTNASSTTKTAEKARSIGVIGDIRTKKVGDGMQGEVDERWKGWLPW